LKYNYIYAYIKKNYKKKVEGVIIFFNPLKICHCSS